MKKLLIVLFSILFIIPLVLSSTYNDCSIYGTCNSNKVTSSSSTNYSLVNVNNSQYLQGYTPFNLPYLVSEVDPDFNPWLTSNVYCHSDGTNCISSMDYTNIAMTNQSNNFSSVQNFTRINTGNSTFINQTGHEAMRIGGFGGTNNHYIDFKFDVASTVTDISTDATWFRWLTGFTLATGTKVAFGSGANVVMKYKDWTTGSGRYNFQLGVFTNDSTGAGGNSGYITILENQDMDLTNRRPPNSIDPVLRLYCANGNDANCWLDIYHDNNTGYFGSGKNNLTFNATNNYFLGSVNVTDNVTADNIFANNICYANGTNSSGNLCIPNNNTMFNSTYNSKVDYQFLNNNFNGTGNFTTMGYGIFGTVNITKNLTCQNINTGQGTFTKISSDNNQVYSDGTGIFSVSRLVLNSFDSGSSYILFSSSGSSGVEISYYPGLTYDGTVNSNGFTSSSGSSYENYVVCYATGGVLGHCTSIVSIDGSCTCVSN